MQAIIEQWKVKHYTQGEAFNIKQGEKTSFCSTSKSIAV